MMAAINPFVSSNDSFQEVRVLQLNCLNTEKKAKSTNGKWHSFVYVTSGSGLLVIDFDEHIVLKNKVFFIAKNKFWNWEKAEGLGGLLVQFTDSFYNFIYTGNPKIKSDQSLIGEFFPFINIRKKNETKWEHIFNVIREEYSELTENSSEIICLSLKILILMYQRNTYSKSRIIIADRKKQVLSEFSKLVDNRFVELKTPKRFAQELNITPNYLNAICKEIYNKTVSEIIQERIILEAKRLLAHTGLSVSEITYKLGFQDNSYFGRYFKKAVGLPPERFRGINYNSLDD